MWVNEAFIELSVHHIIKELEKDKSEYDPRLLVAELGNILEKEDAISSCAEEELIKILKDGPDSALSRKDAHTRHALMKIAYKYLKCNLENLENSAAAEAAIHSFFTIHQQDALDCDSSIENRRHRTG